MQTTLTVRLSDAETQYLKQLCELTGKSRSEVVRDALRASALVETLRASQKLLAPEARKIGWLTEEDILNDVS